MGLLPHPIFYHVLLTNKVWQACRTLILAFQYRVTLCGKSEGRQTRPSKRNFEKI